MRLFVSALEYSANIHLKYLLREMIKSENIELCGIFDENIIVDIMREVAESKNKNNDSRGSIFDETQRVASEVKQKSGLCSHERGNKTDLSIDEASGKLPDLSQKDNALCGKSLCDISQVAVMGFIDVIKRARFFLELRKKCVNLALSADKILLMDSSSFNIPLAKRVKKRDSHKMIMYYILPQVWAWKPWRARIIEANCDKLAAILPFEVRCYKKKAKFVGHPLLDEIRHFRLGNSPLELHSADLANFGRSQTSSLVSRPKFAKNYESQTENPSVVDSAQSAESNKNSALAHRISPDSWCKKSESKGAVVPPADFLLESDKRGTPPKSEKRQLLARRGSGAGGAALLRKETSESNAKSVDCFGDESPRNNESIKIFTFMPGSRLSEINRIFPIFLQVKDELKKLDSKAQFNLVVPKKFKLKNLSEIYGNINDFHITFDAHTSLLQSTFAFICSGTATLECALIGTPFVLGYQGRWIEAFVVKQFLNIRFVGLANLLYSHIAPDSQFHIELLQENLNAKNLLDSYHNANPNDFLTKSLALRAYLKSGSARAVAQWLLEK